MCYRTFSDYKIFNLHTWLSVLSTSQLILFIIKCWQRWGLSRRQVSFPSPCSHATLIQELLVKHISPSLTLKEFAGMLSVLHVYYTSTTPVLTISWEIRVHTIHYKYFSYKILDLFSKINILKSETHNAKNIWVGMLNKCFMFFFPEFFQKSFVSIVKYVTLWSTEWRDGWCSLTFRCM